MDETEDQSQTSEQKRKRMGIKILPDGRRVQDISFLLDAEEEGLERGDMLGKESFPELTVNTKHSHPRAISADHITRIPASQNLVTNLDLAVAQIEDEKAKARNMTNMKLTPMTKKIR